MKSHYPIFHGSEWVLSTKFKVPLNLSLPFSRWLRGKFLFIHSANIFWGQELHRYLLYKTFIPAQSTQSSQDSIRVMLSTQLGCRFHSRVCLGWGAVRVCAKDLHRVVFRAAQSWVQIPGLCELRHITSQSLRLPLYNGAPAPGR